MLTRLTHAAIAFAVTAVMYQAYVLAVAPFIEPQWSPGEVAATAGEAFESDADSLHKYRELLKAYFPPNHWCFARPPKTLENGQALIVFDDYTQSQSGELRVPLCAVIFFSKPRDRAAPPPRDAIILESTGGAVLQLEQTLDKGVKGLGQIQFGQLQGEVTVRSDMHETGPADDLAIKTRDLYMNEDLIRTDQPVDMKIGRHRGYGRELEIRRMKTEGSAGMGSLYGSIEDLTIKHDVEVTIAPGKLRFVDDDDDPSAKDDATLQAVRLPPIDGEKSEQPDAPPVRIKSTGPFRIDLGAYKASFRENVRAWQVHPDGKMDELRSDELTLFFTKTTEWNADGGVAPAGSDVTGQSLAFEPATIEALGTPEAPVVLKAPSHDATAMGECLRIEMAGRSISRITLQQGKEVMLTHRGAEIHARTLQYQLPPKGSAQRIGAMSARGGSGWLRANLDPARPDQLLEVSWKEAMQVVRPPGGQPVLVLDGRPKVSLSGMGTLWADQLQVFLREEPAEAPTHAAKPTAASLPASVTPERIKASGRVAIESTQLTGKVNELEIQIEHPQPVATKPGRTPAQTAGSQAESATPLFDPKTAGDRTYDITGVTLKIDAVMRDRKPEVRGINVDGAVVFQESNLRQTGEPPLRITAEHLRVRGADTPNAEIEIRGAGGENGLPMQLAEITGHGAKILAPAVTLNRGTSTATINSPGELQLLVTRDMQGNLLPRPEPLGITWQESMQLAGRRITFLGDVRVNHATGWLRTRRLVAQTAGEVRFDGGGERQPELEQLECWDGAVAEFVQQDLSGVSSRQHIEVQSLAVNQVNGNISGEGPGLIDSVHLADSPNGWLALPDNKGAAPAPQLVQQHPELRHLHIDFIRGVGGNLHTRTVNVQGNVEAVYGPVKNWDERLSMTPGGSPRPDEVWITCDQLGVTESPAGRLAKPPLRQVELLAEGQVVIEGQDPEQGAFTARGHRAKFDQSKGQFILEGNGLVPATIEQQPYPNAPSSPTTAQRMIFNQKTGGIKLDGFQQGQFKQLQK